MASASSCAWSSNRTPGERVGNDIPELLAPAGGPKQFNAALFAGADAIYCGFGTTFNARRGAESFTSETFGDACRRAHIAGVRVYVTVNVAIRDDEMPSVLALVRRAWLLGADAFIVQDWGLLAEIRTRWPEVECHVSTQANAHDARGVAWCRELGVDRVTLSRELSTAEISRIVGEGVDVECFCHGAICICYSGVCQMSSAAGDRSANRGACAQPCRLPYDVVNGRGEVISAPGRGRPLCPKDFYAFEDLASLVRAGVRSLKIEGRLKAPDYIVSVVSAYRAQLDDLAWGKATDSEELACRRTCLKRAFNRDFTNAYLHGTSGDELMSYERSNNRGETVGEVVGARSFGSVKVRRGGRGGGRQRLRTVGVAETDILLDRPVGKGDLLEIRPLDDPSQFLTAHVPQDTPSGEVLTCRTTRAMERGSIVRVIRSQQAMEQGAQAAQTTTARKRGVAVRVRARMGEPFSVELATADGAARAEARGFAVEAAKTRPVSREDLVEHVGRMGSTPFEPLSFVVDMDEGCGMGFSAVHRVRTQACEMLEKAILNPFEMRSLGAAPSREAIHAALGQQRHKVGVHEAEVCAIVATSEAARSAREAGATRIYATAESLDVGSWPKWVIPLLDEVCREADHERLDAYVRKAMPVAVGNVSELSLAQERGALPEVRGCIPVHNRSCVAALEAAGACGLWLSPELSLAEIAEVAPYVSMPVGVVTYGRPRTMTTEHCVLQVANRCIHDCVRCRLRRERSFLRNDVGDLFPVQTDSHGRSRVYSARVLDATPEVPALAEAGVARFAADCTLLSASEAARAVRRVEAAVRAWREGRTPAAREQGCTSGHLFAPIS